MASSPAPFPAAAPWLDRSDAYARREPAKAVASAFGLGLLLQLLPLAALTAASVRLLCALSRPALLCLGLLKALELCRNPSLPSPHHD